ncbi:MarR family winged helix-turn-helix transcriptional regulator [Siccirubricoccus phaeus]|uniref:MarR family winged helix-turn-helix transcriptional regulator n=1 Tax=Siccirubricoccus phaeus TaxID=2595053 RepID=UPI0011F3B6BD|nr:MarR family winged helix-turn-helix transcriptional regulator [Siccirubricoccus phaeus]
MDQPVFKADDTTYDVTKQIGFLIRKASQRHLAIFSDLLAPLSLTPAQFTTLCTLRDHGECSQADLVRATAVDQATIRGVVERLEARGLIQMSRSSDDGRKVIMWLTTMGAATLEAAIPQARRITEETLKNLNPAERFALEFLLQKISE